MPSANRPRATYLGLLVAALVAVVVAATLLALRTETTVAAVDPAPQTLALGPPASAEVFAADAPLAPAGEDLAASFAELAGSVDATIGVAIAPVGNATAPLSLGEWTTGPAWSTIKVPLAIAALRASPQLTGSAAAAITRSDNAAAETLWSSLGDPATAAASVEAVLRAGGDGTTVESRKVRPEFSAFGQTIWPLVNQAVFLASAACNPADRGVIELMTNVIGDQRWGLGSIPGAAIKGGWGPTPGGNYEVRQIGIVDTPTGKASVAIGVAPASGAFSDGVNAVDVVADWVKSHLAELPSGNC